MTVDTFYLTAYFIILGLLSLCGIHRYKMLWLYYRHRDKPPVPKATFDRLPKITIQLPLFNELYVAERSIDAITSLDYPKDLLEIQVLDDSTDETTEICRGKVREYQLLGYDIELLHRTDRRGFKAGALKEGLRRATGEFVAIFDADFVPPQNLLRRIIHHFTDPAVGMVQTRWSHINREYSLLTQIQAILLDGHFVIEQTARNRSGRFFNFNGTAGVWRRKAIDDAGGWEGDTLTEDLDLSFRAQMAGYRFVFLKDVACPAELPVEMNAFKSQQRRWAKGHVQVGKKLLGSIFRSSATRAQKVEAGFQLLMVYAYPCVVLLMLLLLPLLSMQWRSPDSDRDLAWLFIDLPVFLAATTSIWSFYLASQMESVRNWWTRIAYLPLVIGLGTAIALSNTRAVLEGLFGKCGQFVRTPKYGVRARNDDWLNKKYASMVNLLPVVEILFGLYISFLIFTAIEMGRVLSLPFLFLFQFGFFYLGVSSLIQPFVQARSAAAVPAEVPQEVESVA